MAKINAAIAISFLFFVEKYKEETKQKDLAD